MCVCVCVCVCICKCTVAWRPKSDHKVGDGEEEQMTPPAKHRGNARTQLSNISQYYFMESIQKRYRSTALLFLVFCSCVRFLRIRP